MTIEPRYPFLLVDVEPHEVETMIDVLFDLGADGVEQRDEGTLAKNARPGVVTLSAAFAERARADEAASMLDDAFTPRIEEVVGDAWRDAWKEHFRPFTLCEGLVVRPPWEPYDPKPNERVLELEPGRAFGTGLHETTRLVAEALAEERTKLAGQTVLDVGTGSGILALVALDFGAGRVVATDNDPDVLDVVRENAARNGHSGRVDVSTTDVTDLDAAFPIVLANIEAKVLVPLAKAISARVAAGGRLYLSGILAPQESEVIAAYLAHGLRHLRTVPKGEWILLAFERPVS